MVNLNKLSNGWYVFFINLSVLINILIKMSSILIKIIEFYSVDIVKMKVNKENSVVMV